MLYLEANNKWTRVLGKHEEHRPWAEYLQKSIETESTDRTELERKNFRQEIKQKKGAWHLGVVCLPHEATHINDIFLKNYSQNCSTSQSWLSLNKKDVNKSV